MATIRDAYFPSLFDFSISYCTRFKDITKTLICLKNGYMPETLNVVDGVVRCWHLKDIQLLFKKKKGCYIPGVQLDVIIVDNIVYMSDIVMGLKKAKNKLRKTHILPDVPKLIVDS